MDTIIIPLNSLCNGRKDHNGNQLEKPIRNEMGDRVLHRWKKANLVALLEDYELITA